MNNSKDNPGQPVPEAGATRRRGRAPADDPIAAGLRRMWADAEQEPVPDDLLALIDCIDAASASAGNGSKGGTA